MRSSENAIMLRRQSRHNSSVPMRSGGIAGVLLWVGRCQLRVIRMLVKSASFPRDGRNSPTASNFFYTPTDSDDDDDIQRANSSRCRPTTDRQSVCGCATHCEGPRWVAPGALIPSTSIIIIIIIIIICTLSNGSIDPEG